MIVFLKIGRRIMGFVGEMLGLRRRNPLIHARFHPIKGTILLTYRRGAVAHPSGIRIEAVPGVRTHPAGAQRQQKSALDQGSRIICRMRLSTRRLSPPVHDAVGSHPLRHSRGQRLDYPGIVEKRWPPWAAVYGAWTYSNVLCTAQARSVSLYFRKFGTDPAPKLALRPGPREDTLPSRPSQTRCTA